MTPTPSQAADLLAAAEASIYEQRLRAVLDVVNRYLPPDGIAVDLAMSEIIALVDPWPVAGTLRGMAATDTPPADAFTVNFVRLAGLSKDKARECEEIVRTVLAARGVALGANDQQKRGA